MKSLFAIAFFMALYAMFFFGRRRAMNWYEKLGFGDFAAEMLYEKRIARIPLDLIFAFFLSLLLSSVLLASLYH